MRDLSQNLQMPPNYKFYASFKDMAAKHKIINYLQYKCTYGENHLNNGENIHY